MADITVLGTAAQQLRPLENTNLGAIVEENIRYWQRFDDEQEAARKASAARQAEFEYKQAKDKQDALLKIVETTKSPDSSGFFDYESAKYNNAQQESLFQSIEAARRGDVDLIELQIKAGQIKENMRVVSNINNLSAEVSKRLVGKEPNPVLDRDKVGFMMAFPSNTYKLDPEKNVATIINPVTGRQEVYTIAELNNKMRALEYSPTTDFSEEAKKVADGIGMSTVDDNKLITGQIRKVAEDKAVEIMSETDKALEYAWNVNHLGIKDNPELIDAIRSYDPDQMKAFKLRMAEQFKADVISRIDTETNFLNNQQKRMSLEEQRRKMAEERSIAQIATDGTIEKNVTIANQQVKLGDNEIAYLRPAAAKPIMINIKGKQVKFMGHSTATDGTTTIYGIEEYMEEVPKRGENGNILRGKDIFLTNGDGSYKVKTDKKGEPILVGGKPVYETKPGEPITEKVTRNRLVETKNRTIVTSVFGSLPTPDGRFLNNATETTRAYQQHTISKLSLQSANNTQTPARNTGTPSNTGTAINKPKFN